MEMDDAYAKDSLRMEDPKAVKCLGVPKSSKGFSALSTKAKNEINQVFGEAHPSFRRRRGSRKYSRSFSVKCDNSIIVEDGQMCHPFSKSGLLSPHLNTVNSQFDAYMDIVANKFNSKSLFDTDDQIEQREDIKTSLAIGGDWDTSVEVDSRYDQREDKDTPRNMHVDAGIQSITACDKYAIVQNVPAQGKVIDDLSFSHSRRGNISRVPSCLATSDGKRESKGKYCLPGAETLDHWKNELVSISHWIQCKLGSLSGPKKTTTKKVRFFEPIQTEMDGERYENVNGVNTTATLQPHDIVSERSEDVCLQLDKLNNRGKEAFEIEEIYCQSNSEIWAKSTENETKSPTLEGKAFLARDIPTRFVRVSPKQRGRFGGRKRTLTSKKPSR